MSDIERWNNAHGFHHRTVSGIVTEGRAVLYEVHISGSPGDSVAIYEGTDPTSGRLIGTRDIAVYDAGLSVQHGIKIERGIYVTLSATVTSCTVIYDDIREPGI